MLAWGANGRGQLGIDEPGNRPDPVEALLDQGVIPMAVAAGGVHSLAITSTGDALA